MVILSLFKKIFRNKIQNKNSSYKITIRKNDELLKHLKIKKILYLLHYQHQNKANCSTIIEYNKNYKIILIGGALNIIAGVEEVPKNFEYLESFGIEFDTYKRLNRFLITGTSFFYNYFISNQKI